MNAKNGFKLILDIILTVLFLILIDPKNTGFSFHEMAGLSITVLFSVHIILNWKWVKSITKKLFTSKLKARPKLYYILNVISLLSVATIIFTGIEISRVLFASESSVTGQAYVVVHKWVSYLCLGLFGIHAALHWRFVVHTVRRWSEALFKPGWLKPVLGVGSVILVLGLLYTGITARAQEGRVAAVGQEPPGPQSNVYPGSPSMPPSSSLSGQSTRPSGEAESSSSTSVNTQVSGQTVTLSDYLSRMFCTGCAKHCSLLSPQCSKGFQQVEAAKIQYQQQYGLQAVS